MQQYLKNTWPLLIIALIAGVGVMLGEAFIDVFAFKKSIVMEFPFYRLITGHFTHSNLNHYLLNLAGLAAIVLLFYEYLSAKNQCILFLTGSISISILMLFIYQKETYLGLSAYLHFLFAWAVINDLKSRRKTTYILLLGLLVKIIYELAFYQAGATEKLIGIDVAVESHAIGAAIGTLAGLFTLLLKHNRKMET